MKSSIKLYLDEDVSVLLAYLLKARGFDVVTTLHEKMLGKSDREQLEYAIDQERVLLTHNRIDFEKLFGEFTEFGKQQFGIIIAKRRSEYPILRRLLVILNKLSSEDMKNSIRYV